MGCKSSKPDGAIVVSSIDDIRAFRRGETYRLVAELRSLGFPSGAPPALMLDDPSLVGAPDLKEAISKNPDLLSLINDHLHANVKTPMSLTGVKGYLDRSQVAFSTIRRALECFQKENAERIDEKKKNNNNNNNKKKKNKSTNKYPETVDKLKELRELGDPFAELNTGELREPCTWLRSLLAALRRRDDELETKQRSVKKRRKIWDVVYTAGTVAVLACSVILAAVASPAAAIAGTTAIASAMKLAEPWINLWWAGREVSLQEEKDVTAAMRKMGGLLLHAWENVRLTADRLKIDMDAMLDGVDFAISREEIEAKIGVFEQIMAKKGNVENRIDSLKEKLDWCGDEIRKAATELLKTIMKDI